jgi:hypothetical protein
MVDHINAYMPFAPFMLVCSVQCVQFGDRGSHRLICCFSLVAGYQAAFHGSLSTGRVNLSVSYGAKLWIFAGAKMLSNLDP